MARKILMPKMSDTMEEGVLAKWVKKPGDLIKAGEVIAEIETDKATMDFEATDGEAGVLLYVAVEEGITLPVDTLLAIVGEKGEDFQALLSNTSLSPAPQQQATDAKAEVRPAVVASINKNTDQARVLRMPKMSDTMEEGVIAKWLKKPGDLIKAGEVMAEIETDKATMELEATDDEVGSLLYVAAQEGESVKVDNILLITGKSDADWQSLLNNDSPAATTQVRENVAAVSEKTDTPTAAVQQTSVLGSRLKASPLAKKLAKEKGFNLIDINGSGEGGRIVRKDVENFVPTADNEKVRKSSTPAPQASGQEHFEEVPVSQMRKTIARRLAESKFSAPHFYLTMEIRMDEASKSRAAINEFSPVKVSFNDMIVKAAAIALRKHPKINASWLGDKIRYYRHVHIGVAVAVDEGLLVPVVRFADSKSLSQIAEETKSLAQKAKEKKLQPEDWSGNTFSVSNLGMFGIEEFTAIINPPDACILAVGGIKEIVTVNKGQFEAAQVMKVTLSCDHRVVDGALGAAFLQTLKTLLEAPVKMLA